MRVCLTLYRTADGHLCGAAQGGSDSPVMPFWGTFELVKVLEDLGPEEPPAGRDHPVPVEDPRGQDEPEAVWAGGRKTNPGESG